MSKLANVVQHLDSWVNQITGAGTARDKTQFGSFEPGQRLTDPDLAALMYHNAIAKKVIRTIPRMIRRAGYDFTLSSAGKKDDKSKDLVKAEAKRLALDGRMYDASIWGRLYGGAGILVVTAEKDLIKPLNDQAPGPISALTVFDRRYLRIVQRYSSPTSPNFGLPEFFELLPEAVTYQGIGKPPAQLPTGVRIHESRIVCFFGDEVDRFEAQQVELWSYSVLQTLFDNLRNGDSSISSLGVMLLEASTSVFAVEGLIAALSSRNSEALMRRMAISDMAKSSYRSVLLDANKERFDRVAVQFSGASDAADRVMQYVAAAAEMPMTILFGTSPAGMNATGESDMRQFYDRVADERAESHTPKQERLLRLIAASLEVVDPTVTVEAKALWQMTSKEKAELRASTAASDKMYVDMLVVEPEAVALARGRDGEFNPDASIPIDVKRLERELRPKPVAETPPSVELAPTAYEAVLTVRMVLQMLGQDTELPDGTPIRPDLDLTIAEAKAKAGAEPALPGVPGLPLLP